MLKRIWRKRNPSILRGKEHNARDMEGTGLIPGSGRCPREGNGKPLQYSCLRYPWIEDPGR